MSKLALFFDKKKKKSLKTSSTLEKQDQSKVVYFGDGDNEVEDEWAVQTEQPAAQRECENAVKMNSEVSEMDTSSMSWMKVSVVATLPTNRMEEKKVWAANEVEEKKKEEEPTEEEKADEATEDTPKKWRSPSLAKKLHDQKSGKIATDNDPSLAASVAAYPPQKKGSPQKPIIDTKNKDKKDNEKEKEKEKRDKQSADTSNQEDSNRIKFNVWNFVQLDLSTIGGVKIPQDDEAALQKYIKRGPRIQPQTVHAV